MKQSSHSNNQAFGSSVDRLTAFLSEQKQNDVKFEPLTPDASTREYFRVNWNNNAAIACVYPEAIDLETNPFIDITNLFQETGLPVPEIYFVCEDKGIIVQEDFGDSSLLDLYERATEDEKAEYKAQAISLIAKIQAATKKAFETNSVASRLAFDVEKLSWELNFFLEHYFRSLRGEDIGGCDFNELKVELEEISKELSLRPRVLCHRDYHAMNLMVDKNGQLRLIDYQDARMGPVTYDLVSLLLDRQLEMPSMAEIRDGRLFLLHERKRFGLEAIDPDEMGYEFRLMTIQRCLKATGTFSFQTGVRGRGDKYLKYINPMLMIVNQAAEWLNRFPTLRRMIKTRLEE